MTPSWMAQALALARRAYKKGEVPVGALVVRDRRIIARAHNLVEKWQNPLAHAEMLTLLQAQKVLKSKYLVECDFYVTLQPCPMCARALFLVRPRTVYFGAYETRSPAPSQDLFIGGLYDEECSLLLQKFFKEKR